MQHLIDRISEQTGVPQAHVSAVIENVALFVKEKYPLLASTVDTVLKTAPAEQMEINSLHG